MDKDLKQNEIVDEQIKSSPGERQILVEMEWNEIVYFALFGFAPLVEPKCTTFLISNPVLFYFKMYQT